METKHMKLFSMIAAAASLCSCSDGDDPVLTQKDWSTTEFFSPTDEASPTTFYKPSAVFVAEPMPFYYLVAKIFKIMYLHQYRPNQAGTYHPFWCVETSDAANYVSLGELIPTGGLYEQDAALGTGSVFYNEADQTYYTFYTGHAYHSDVTGYGEAVMMATSKDFKTWVKDRSFFIKGEDVYSKSDFRDPMVFKGDDNRFHMVVSTRKGGKGVLAEYVSDDLRNWTSAGEFMTMMWDRFYECPDVFKMGDYWYLVYSEMHDAIRKVQYFKGRTLDELKACTANDAGLWPDSHEGFLDSRGLYAAKTASDGTDRYIWGWCGTRAGEDNTSSIEWAGSLVAHRLIQHADGTLTLGEVPALAGKYNQRQSVTVTSTEGNVTRSDNNFSLDGDAAVIFSRLGKHNRISFTVTTSGDSDRFGFSFGRGSDSEKYYSLIVNPEGDALRKINFEEEGIAGTGFLGNNDGYLFNRPDDNVYDVTIVTDNSVCVVYINDVANYTNRIYGMSQNCWSLNSYGGNIKIDNLEITQY